MTREQWKEFAPYFSSLECGEGMDYAFMKNVLFLRHLLNCPMVVHAGYDLTGHAPQSYHYNGQALDFHCENVSPRKVMQAIDSLGCFGGVGFYFWWRNPGFHIDNRPVDKYQRWCSPRPQKYIYLIGGGS